MPTEITTIINAALDRMRDEQSLTESELARACGVDESTLWRWRNGKNLSKSTRILIPLVVQRKQIVIDQAA